MIPEIRSRWNPESPGASLMSLALAECVPAEIEVDSTRR
jgi:hypothetical protein